jgi:hypothetical protein
MANDETHGEHDMKQWQMRGGFVWMLILLMSMAVQNVMAQDDTLVDALIAEDVRLEMQVDAFGIEQTVLVGRILNDGDTAILVDEVLAELLDADGEVIGEGYGFPVNQCGVALFDVPLLPERHQDFALPLDLYEDDAEIDDWTFEFFARTSDAELPETPELPKAIQTITDAEVVAVEWLDETMLRYGVGCDGELATRYDWYNYNIADGGIMALDVYPNAEFITEAFIQQSGINLLTQGSIEDETLIESSYLTFPTQSRRVIWQSDINDIFTAEVDGSFKRRVQTRLAIYSLQGFVFSPLGNFVAYYFGAYGEPVRWFTASMDGTPISAVLDNNPLSNTVPGLTNDARRVIISGEFDEGIGYALQSTVGSQRQFLFEVDELAGNNYPAPAYRLVDNNTRYIYFVRPEAGETILECYHLEAGTHETLATLPFSLLDDERAWTWLSPEGTQMVIGANGRSSGAWLVDLTGFEVCQ